MPQLGRGVGKDLGKAKQNELDRAKPAIKQDFVLTTRILAAKPIWAFAELGQTTSRRCRQNASRNSQFPPAFARDFLAQVPNDSRSELQTGRARRRNLPFRACPHTSSAVTAALYVSCKHFIICHTSGSQKLSKQSAEVSKNLLSSGLQCNDGSALMACPATNDRQSISVEPCLSCRLKTPMKIVGRQTRCGP